MLERFPDEFGAHVVGDSKADEHPCIAVNYQSEIHIRPVRDRQIGDIANQHPICSGGCKVPLDQVSKHHAIGLTPGGGDLAFFTVATQAKLLHDPGDALMVDRPVVVVGVVMRQLCHDAFSTVELVLLVKDRLDLRP